MADQEVQENNSATTEEAPAPAEGEVPPATDDKPGEETEQAPTDETPADQPAEEQPPQEEQKPEGEGESPPTEEAPQSDAIPAGGEEGEVAPTEAEAGQKEGEEPAADGEAPPADGEQKPEGETSTEEAAEGDTADGGETAPGGEGEEGGAAEGTPTEGAGEEGGEQAPVVEGEEQKAEGEEGAELPAEESKSPVPQSDTFAEGERAESPVPVGVGEKLSREGSPVEQEQVPLPEVLEPGTPERGSPDGDRGQMTTFEEEEEEDEEDDEDDEEEEEEQPEFDREELIERYHQAIVEREQLQQKNYQLQHKLAEYFRKKKADESRQEYDKNVTDQEQRYLKYMASLEDLRRQDMQERENYKLQIHDLKARCEDRKERVDDERRKFMDFKKQVALNALNSRSGRPIPPKDIEAYLAAEDRKEGEVINVRLENIKLKNKLKKKEHQLKSKEELAEGLHLIDFEQLKIENQTYNEKIEERNEELLKLRKKITSTVQVLTHLKEKLQYVQAENQIQKRNLREVESEVGQKRDILSRTKQARDALRIDNQRLKQNCGLLGNESLLRDFEERKDEGDDLRDKLDQLKLQHAELTLNCNQVRRKIEQARTGRA
ncbi:coiled-coil domain-containing protein 96-like [Mya arenaria]|uniref:coiled-coil domain-containing protein 96-like n=1 Tax=Mya arenaria TaxID=6604 RepID=UPI0022DEF0DF|nr:coiled-coil domain-containing protein 96-like [Mya arenaria]